MIDLLRILSYPSVPLSRVNDLPRQSGIYYARKGFEVQYIGLSTSLWHRWTNTGSKIHHRKVQLQQMGGVKIHYRLCDRHELEYLEVLEIRRFDPPLNVVKPIPEKPSQLAYPASIPPGHRGSDRGCHCRSGDCGGD